MRSAIIENGIVKNLIKGQVEGSTPCGDDVGVGWLYDGEAFTAPPQPEPPERAPEEQVAAIDEERMRRIEYGSTFAVPDIADPIPLTGRPFDQSVYLALLMRAEGAKAAGITDPVLRIRAGDDVIHMLTPDQMIALISQAMGWFEHIMAVSWAMKDGAAPFEAGIPDDVADDAHWSQ